MVATLKLRASRAAKGQTLEPGEAVGLSPEDVLAYFYNQVSYTADKKGWKTMKGLIDHPNDEVTIAMLDWCGMTQEWRALKVILPWKKLKK